MISMKNLDCLVTQEQKLGATGPWALLEHSPAEEALYMSGVLTIYMGKPGNSGWKIR